jgi:hypothetical protein
VRGEYPAFRTRFRHAREQGDIQVLAGRTQQFQTIVSNANGMGQDAFGGRVPGDAHFRKTHQFRAFSFCFFSESAHPFDVCSDFT